MDLVISLLFTFSLIAVSIIVCVLFSTGIEMILAKERGWYFLFLICVAIILLQTFLYSWLPGRVGMEITLLDGAITMEDGAIAHNLGYILISHAVGIFLAVVKYIWSCIRKKNRFMAKFFFLELLIGGILIAASVLLLDSDYKMDYGTDDSIAKPVLYILCAAGLGIMIFVFCSYRKDKKNGTDQNAGAKTGSTQKGSAKSAGTSSTAPSPEAVKRFDEIVEEKNRLDQKGDYAGEIMLLTQALGLPLDGPRKARLWNYLGLANESIGNTARSEECYQNALREDPDNPSALNNLAFIYLGKGNHTTAYTYMDRSIHSAKARNMNPGTYYSNYAIVAGQAGDKATAEKMLKQAEQAGCTKESLASVRSRIGL